MEDGEECALGVQRAVLVVEGGLVAGVLVVVGGVDCGGGWWRWEGGG